MREFIKIQIFEGLKTRLKEIEYEINLINENKSKFQMGFESDNQLKLLFTEKANIVIELKKFG